MQYIILAPLVFLVVVQDVGHDFLWFSVLFLLHAQLHANDVGCYNHSIAVISISQIDSLDLF